MILLRVLNKVGLLKRLNLTFRKQINVVSYRIPVHGTVGFDLFTEREPWMSALLRKILPVLTGQAFVDVGVNQGQTLLIAKSISPRIDYIGFEPNPVCVNYLAHLRSVNDLEPLLIVPCALGETTGVATLYKDPNRPEDSSATIVEAFRATADREKILVPVVSAENLSFLEEKSVGILKIDVEGGEVEVLKVLLGCIRRDRPVIICEVLPAYDSGNVFRISRQQEIESILSQIDYHIYRIRPDGDLDIIDHFGIHTNLEDSNYIFVPKERRTVIGK